MKSAPLTNSKRILEKVTYTPLVLPNASGGGAIEILTALNTLGLVPAEVDVILNQRDIAPQTRNVLVLFSALAKAATLDDRLASAAELAGQSTEALTAGVNAVRNARSQVLADAAIKLKAINVKYLAAYPPPPPPAAAAANSGLSNRISAIEQTMLALDLRQAGIRNILTGPSAQSAPVTTTPAPAQYPAVQVAPEFTTLLGAQIAKTIGAAVQYAQTEDRETFDSVVVSLSPVVPETLRTNPQTVILLGIPFVMDQVKKSASVTSHLSRRNLQPIGLLHLEQLVITPVVIERGELVYSLPLAPLEKVTLSHKEWSVREEEYSRFVQDRFENYSESGVADTTDMAMSSSSQTEHSKTLSMGKPMVPGAATLADPVNTQTASEDVTKEKQSQDKSRRETQQITQRASALSVKDQKISFTVTTVSGTQDFTSRIYENPHQDKVMLVDYFRRMLRWSNELYRTGIRLTYDVVLPDPGRRLRTMRAQLDDLDAQIAAPFTFEYTPAVPVASNVTSLKILGAASNSSGIKVASANFASDKLSIETASVTDLDLLAKYYGTTIPDAPDKLHTVEETYAIVEPVIRDNVFEHQVTLPIPDDYLPVKAWMGGRIARNGSGFIEGNFRHQMTRITTEEFHTFNIVLPENFTTDLTVAFFAYEGAVGHVRVWADIEPTGEAWRKWRATVWTTIRQAAYSRYIEKRDRLREQRVALARLLDAPDALSLRRMEREQVMYLVLQWIFPDFEEGGQIYADAASGKASAWDPALEYGEYIKFIHQSIDWENALVILYPYFWDNPTSHASKLYLYHPDIVHQEFLRAGAARVVLAIQPGYENEVVSLLDKGHLGTLAPHSRFEGIIAKVRAEQKRLTELIHPAFVSQDRAADPEVMNLQKFGEKIGSWIDWTPTSALDMDVRLRSVVEE